MDYKLSIVLNTNENEGPSQAFTHIFMSPFLIRLDENSFSAVFSALPPFHPSCFLVRMLTIKQCLLPKVVVFLPK